MADISKEHRLGQAESLNRQRHVIQGRGKHMTVEVVIVGAGYAGVAAFRTLSPYLKRDNVRLTLISEYDRFVERLRLHQLATGQSIPARPLAEVIGNSTSTRILIGRVSRIELAASQVLLGDGTGARFDHVILATGSTPAWPALPGVRDHAVGVATRDEAERLRDRYAVLPSRSRVVVVGGGFVGVETAAEMAARRRDLTVRIVTSGPVGSWLAPTARRALVARLERHGVAIQDNAHVVAVGPSSVTTSGTEIPSDLTVWAAGLAPSHLPAASGLAVDDRGRMLVDETLTSITDQRIIGAGDLIALPDGGPQRMACQTAIPMGRHAAGTLRRQLSGRNPARYRPRFIWSHTSLGRNDGLTQFSHLDDRPLPVWFVGRPASWFKERVVTNISPSS